MAGVEQTLAATGMRIRRMTDDEMFVEAKRSLNPVFEDRGPYPARLKRDTNGTLRVEFPDIPEAHTFGEDEGEALLQAVDALETALSLYIDDRRDVPAPSTAKRGMKLVTLPALAEAKLALYSTMRTRRVSKAELARRLNCHPPQIDRLLDLNHGSRLDHVGSRFPGIWQTALRPGAGCGVNCTPHAWC